MTLTPADGPLSLAAAAALLAGTAGLRAVARGGAWVDGRRELDAARVIRPGARLELRLPPQGVYTELTLTANDISFEDPWLIALHKQAGWYVGATPWDVHGNALAALVRYLTQRDGAAPPLHLAHQLDRDTSGVLLFSKDPAINPALQAAFAKGTLSKTYLAICAGVPPSTGDISTGHGRSAGGRWRIYPSEQIGAVLPAGGGRIKLARTTYRLVRRGEAAALLEVRLHTGRTHQIRLHLAHIGHPLLGDTRYGGPAQYNGQLLSGQLLHAAHLALRHPATGMPLNLNSPLPGLMEELSRTMD